MSCSWSKTRTFITNEETGLGTNHWVYWLLDRMEEMPSSAEHKPHLNQTSWKP